ncbi:hypothetical protein CBL_08938 [Carabus blaptoides fortunei]
MKDGNISCCLSRLKCSKEPEVLNTAEAVDVFTIQSESQQIQPVPVHGQISQRTRHESMTSCRSGESFQSISTGSLLSTMSKNTGNYDYYSIYSNNSGRGSLYSCQST